MRSEREKAPGHRLYHHLHTNHRPVAVGEVAAGGSYGAATGVTITSGPRPTQRRRGYRRGRSNRFVRVLKAPYKAVRAIGRQFGTRRMRRRGTIPPSRRTG
ncbi:MAG: hypothetical protein M3R15_24610, partial [Acidobacteriota bacterium]|nr:hypothetical protein [Acidobacteriota bacterium]